MEDIKIILNAVMESGYSAQNITFGLGPMLLHKLTPQTMEFTTFINNIQFKDGTERNVIQASKIDMDRPSLPGNNK